MFRAFRKHDYHDIEHFYELWDEHKEVSMNVNFLSLNREHLETLSGLLEKDHDQFHDRSERG
jgi:DNA-binding MltR family transcriptional regulator